MRRLAVSCWGAVRETGSNSGSDCGPAQDRHRPFCRLENRTAPDSSTSGAGLYAAVRCPQSAVRCPPSIVHRSPSAVHRSPSTVHRPPSPDQRPSSIIHYPSSTVHRPPSTVHRPPFTVHRSPHPTSLHLFIEVVPTLSSSLRHMVMAPTVMFMS